MHGSCAEELGPHRRAGADRAAVMGPCAETGWSQDGTGGQSHLRLSRGGLERVGVLYQAPGWVGEAHRQVLTKGSRG